MTTLKLENMLDDADKVCEDGIYATGFALSFFGIEYINQNFLGNLPNPSGDTQLFSLASYVLLGEFVCLVGTGVKSIQFVYDTLKIPAKIVTGKYFKREKTQKPSLSE